MFKKIILSAVVIATLTTGVFANPDTSNIKNIKNNFDLSIVCDPTAQVFKVKYGGTLSFQKSTMYGGTGQNITISADDFCYRLGGFLLENPHLHSQYHSFVKTRMKWTDEAIDNLSVMSISFLMNPNVKSSNLIDFSQAIIERNYEKAKKIMNENRLIIYQDGEIWENDKDGNSKQINRKDL